MKRTIKTYFKLFVFLFGISLFLVNCETEEEILQKSESLSEDKSQEFEFIISEISSTEIQENETISRKLKEIKETLSKGKENTQSKDVYSSEYDFTINTNFAKYIESVDSTYHSYTFPIKRTEDNGLYENLLLSLQPDETYKVFIISYNLTEEEWVQFVNGFDIGLSTDDITSTEIDGNGIVSDVFSKVETTNCYWILTEFCANGNHPGGYINGKKCPAYDTDAESFCLGNGGGGGAPPSPPVGSDDDDTDNGANGGTAGTGLTTETNATTGVELNEGAIYTELILAHTSFEFLTDECANDVITTEILLDVNTNLINTIRNIFNADANVTLDIRNTSSVPSAANAATDLPENIEVASGVYQISIGISNDFFNNPTKLAIALVAIHELVHVKLIYHYLHGNLLDEYPEFTGLNTALGVFIDSDRTDTDKIALDDAMHVSMVDLISPMAYSLYRYAQGAGMDSITAQYCSEITKGSFYNTPAMTLIDTGSSTPEELNNKYVNEQDNTTNALGDDCD